MVMRLNNILSVALVFLIFGNTAYAIGEKKDRTLQEWIGLTKSSQKIQCIGAKADYDIASKKNLKEKASIYNQRIQLSCNCIPNKLDSFSGSLSKTRRNSATSVDEFKEIIRPVLNTCVATQMRSQLSSACAKDESVVKNTSKRKTYCMCFTKQLEKYSDADLGGYANTAHREFTARANALRDGRPVPKKSSTFLNEIEDVCLKKI